MQLMFMIFFNFLMTIKYKNYGNSRIQIRVLISYPHWAKKIRIQGSKTHDSTGTSIQKSFSSYATQPILDISETKGWLRKVVMIKIYKTGSGIYRNG